MDLGQGAVRESSEITCEAQGVSDPGMWVCREKDLWITLNSEIGTGPQRVKELCTTYYFHTKKIIKQKPLLSDFAALGPE